jgi:hypothetical protein
VYFILQKVPSIKRFPVCFFPLPTLESSSTSCPGNNSHYGRKNENADAREHANDGGMIREETAFREIMGVLRGIADERGYGK